VHDKRAKSNGKIGANSWNCEISSVFDWIVYKRSPTGAVDNPSDLKNSGRGFESHKKN
jgi:hypothetical protein